MGEETIGLQLVVRGSKSVCLDHIISFIHTRFFYVGIHIFLIFGIALYLKDSIEMHEKSPNHDRSQKNILYSKEAEPVMEKAVQEASSREFAVRQSFLL